MDGVALIDWAGRTAERLMGQLGRRLDHVKAVAQLADLVGHALEPKHDLLVAAAFLHDIGYAEPLASSGFHPLDGARFVRAEGHEKLALLVANHSGARYEARLRGIDEFEEEFPFMDSDLDRALTYCDLTTGPDGTRVTLEERVAEITRRYGPAHTVARAINACVPEFEEACEQTEARMAEAGVVVTGLLALPR